MLASSLSLPAQLGLFFPFFFSLGINEESPPPTPTTLAYWALISFSILWTCLHPFTGVRQWHFSLPDFLFNLALKLLYLTIHTPSLCRLVIHQGSGPSIHLRFWQLSSVTRSALVLSGCSIQHLHPPDLTFCKHFFHFHHPPLWIPRTWSKMKSTWKFEQIQTSQPLVLISNLSLSPFNIKLHENKAHCSYFRLKWIQCKDEISCKSVGRIGKGSSRLIITQN